jgi:DNA helicase HerA-like ATPase
MSNFAAELRGTGIFGASGTGKTTLAFRYLQNSNVACRFIFDDRGQAAQRLKLSPVSTIAAMERALATRWVCYYPGAEFRGDTKAALKFFLAWVFNVSRRGGGRKIVFIDEVWRHVSPSSIPPELATIAQEGRVEELELVTATQRPHKLNESLLGQMTEIVCFRLQHRLALQCLTDLDIDDEHIQRVRNLASGSFVSFSLESGKIFTGRIF